MGNLGRFNEDEIIKVMRAMKENQILSFKRGNLQVVSKDKNKEQT